MAKKQQEKYLIGALNDEESYSDMHDKSSNNLRGSHSQSKEMLQNDLPPRIDHKSPTPSLDAERRPTTNRKTLNAQFDTS
jgi:hypothetical protein